MRAAAVSIAISLCVAGWFAAPYVLSSPRLAEQPAPTASESSPVGAGEPIQARAGIEQVLKILSEGFAKDGVTLHRMQTVNMRLTLLDSETLRVDFAPPRPLLDVRYFLRFTNKPITALNLTPRAIEVQIDGLPDVTLPVE